jgi:hypothetical protein
MMHVRARRLIERPHARRLIEVKSGTRGDALLHLENGVLAVQLKGLLGDLWRVELAIKKGQELGDNNWMVKNGFLLDIAGNKPIEIKGFKNLFMRVIDL